MKLEFWEKVRLDYMKNKSEQTYDVKHKSTDYVKSSGTKFKFVFELEGTLPYIKLLLFIL